MILSFPLLKTFNNKQSPACSGDIPTKCMQHDALVINDNLMPGVNNLKYHCRSRCLYRSQIVSIEKFFYD
mgnify:CR=1 FL=1